jgi:SAM-dependent methyltransferase
MSEIQDVDIAIEHFDGCLHRYGHTVRALGWGSKESQRKRFEALAGLADLKGKRILDVGCGFGDFYGYLVEEGIVLQRYLGSDINENMIRMASGHYPDAEFRMLDILSEPCEEEFEYVLASGIFALNSPTWTTFVHKMLSKMFSMASEGIAVNFLSGHTSGKKFPESRYPYPDDIIGFVVQHLTNRFVVRHDYLPNDFTLYLLKEGFSKTGRSA